MEESFAMHLHLSNEIQHFQTNTTLTYVTGEAYAPPFAPTPLITITTPHKQPPSVDNYTCTNYPWAIELSALFVPLPHSNKRHPLYQEPFTMVVSVPHHHLRHQHALWGIRWLKTRVVLIFLFGSLVFVYLLDSTSKRKHYLEQQQHFWPADYMETEPIVPSSPFERPPRQGNNKRHNSFCSTVGELRFQHFRPARPPAINLN